MPTLPIIFTAKEEKGFLSSFTQHIKKNNTKDFSSILLNYPTVYIHYWQGNTVEIIDRKGVRHQIPKYKVYVGESNDVFNRTKEHYSQADDINNWQYHLTHGGKTPNLIVIGHEHFNKSFTLDMENRLIEYIMSMNSVEILFNGRSNPQNEYYPDSEFDDVFHHTWKKLRRIEPLLFSTETEIEHSAIFKASPLKKLTQDQIEAKETILAKIYEACENNLEGQLIFVQGEAGTGKTVLNSSLFYDLICRGSEIVGKKLECHLMVNHDQQIAVYEQLAKRLNLGNGIIHKPTSFINKISPDRKVDVSFVDEGHLLLTRGKQSYQGKNQLADIIDRSRLTVLMFDEYQVLKAEEYWEPALLEKFKNIAFNQNNYIGLSQQLRMRCSHRTIEWLNDFTLNQRLSPFIKDPEYEVRSFDTPESLYLAIKAKASSDEDSLSRVVASYDWEYSDTHRPKNSKYWGVKIGDWFLPWNYEILKTFSSKEKRHIKHMAWAEQPHTIGEVGSTFTIQGFDLSYVGVILGPSVRYHDGEIIFDSSKSKNIGAIQQRTMTDGSHKSFGELFIRNEVKVLMSRGVKGLYIYACDRKLRKALNKALHQDI